MVGHYLDDKRKRESVIKYETILNVLAPSNLLLAEYLSLLLFTFGFVCLLNLILRKKKTSPFYTMPLNFMFNLFSQHEPFFRRASPIGLFYVFLLLFLFFMRHICTNNIQTNKVNIHWAGYERTTLSLLSCFSCR